MESTVVRIFLKFEVAEFGENDNNKKAKHLSYFQVNIFHNNHYFTNINMSYLAYAKKKSIAGET